MEFGTPYDRIGPLCESAALESVSIAEMEQGPMHAPASISSREIGRDDFVPIREPVDEFGSQRGAAPVTTSLQMRPSVACGAARSSLGAHEAISWAVLLRFGL
jgi:hypothetical protein